MSENDIIQLIYIYIFIHYKGGSDSDPLAICGQANSVSNSGPLVRIFITIIITTTKLAH